MVEIEFIADIHISPLTVSALKDHGYHIWRVTEFIPANSSDTEIIELARQKNAVIITQDLDFSALVAQSGRHSR